MPSLKKQFPNIDVWEIDRGKRGFDRHIEIGIRKKFLLNSNCHFSRLGGSGLSLDSCRNGALHALCLWAKAEGSHLDTLVSWASVGR
jgi:hypothetical protein